MEGKGRCAHQSLKLEQASIVNGNVSDNGFAVSLAERLRLSVQPWKTKAARLSLAASLLGRSSVRLSLTAPNAAGPLERQPQACGFMNGSNHR